MSDIDYWVETLARFLFLHRQVNSVRSSQQHEARTVKEMEIVGAYRVKIKITRNHDGQLLIIFGKRRWLRANKKWVRG